MVDMVVLLNSELQRTSLKYLANEELPIKYLDKYKVEEKMSNQKSSVVYPSDGIKGAKEISSSLQKLFSEYQKVYAENYQQIHNILSDSKTLSKNINTKRVDASLKELEELYTESNASDVLSLRLTTLSERLKLLVGTEQMKN